jgi:hypothetical protein
MTQSLLIKRLTQLRNLEFINYYYFQLSHDSKNDVQYLIQHKRLRRSLLSKDLLELSSSRNRFLKE